MAGCCWQEGIDAAVQVMQSGRLFRYCAESAETSHAAAAEQAFAQLVDQTYAVGVNSCSSAIVLALMAVGVQAGDQVLTNGFTFTALPSTIMRLGASPVLVETAHDWTMDLADLSAQADAHPAAKVLLLSHMRGKVADMDAVMALCKKHGLTLVEDCAHGCGVLWRGKPLGGHGAVAAYSTQSDKVINSGEGGFVCTNDDATAAKLIYWSGAYERRYTKHAARPSDALCEDAMRNSPNLSMRMTEVAAAMMLPLIRNLEQRVLQYNARHGSVVATMREVAGDLIVVPPVDSRVRPVGDHLNFFLHPKTTDAQNALFRATCTALGVPCAWFCSDVNCRWHVNWRRFGAPAFELPRTDALLRLGYDLKLPPHFEDEDFVHLAAVIGYAANVAHALEE